MNIRGIEGLSPEEIYSEIQRGGRFVCFEYCISIIIITFKRPTDIYFLKSGDRAIVRRLLFTIFSMLVGWWGLPWGIIYTPMAIYTNIKGGKDVTDEILSLLSENE